MKASARVMLILVGVLLVLTAWLHSSGWRQIGPQLSSLPPPLVDLVFGLWFFFSWHLALVALVTFFSAVSGAGWLRPVLFFCAAVALGDFLWVYRLAGWFVGTVLLLLSALGLFVAAWIWRRQ